MEKVKKAVSGLVDVIFILSFLSIVNPNLIGWVLSTSGEWQTITFGEYFSDSKLWFNMWVLSLVYIPIRLLLKDKFWGILFGEKEAK